MQENALIIDAVAKHMIGRLQQGGVCAKLKGSAIGESTRTKSKSLMENTCLTLAAGKGGW